MGGGRAVGGALRLRVVGASAAPNAPAAGISRHAAITGSLHSYANYKSWAERVRTNWEPDKDKAG